MIYITLFYELHEERLLENRLYMIGNTPFLQSARPFIYREAGSATRMAMDHYLQQGDRTKRIELTSNEAVKQALIAGLGYSILSLIGIRNELQYKQLFVIPSKGLPIVTHWRLIWLKGKKMMPAAIAYLEFIREEKQHIAESQYSWLQSFR